MIMTSTFGTGDSYKELVDYLETSYPLDRSVIKIRLNYIQSTFDSCGGKITGFTRVDGYTAIVDVAAKQRLKREVALTIAHEYKHCMQFIRDGLYKTKENAEVLEQDAKDFAEGVLEQLWKEKKIYYPSEP